ncbi:hypothetical protein BC830DRAFT_1154091 [Chytriomyces sp. MP71]|nr:hypothetical protein BC830DRAFT_1154091 [Chytriomyces sp. MP71]
MTDMFCPEILGPKLKGVSHSSKNKSALTLGASMPALAFLLLSGLAHGQVLLGCYLKTDPPIALVSSSMDPSLCQQSCPSSPYVMIAPSLSDESSFQCSCAAKIPGTQSGSCIIPCPGGTNPSSTALCGGFRFSHTSIGWSVYSAEELPSPTSDHPSQLDLQPQPAIIETITSPVSLQVTSPAPAAAQSESLELTTPGTTQSEVMSSSTSRTSNSLAEPTKSVDSTHLSSMFATMSAEFSSTVAANEAGKASNANQQTGTSSTPRLVILSISALILVVLLLAFACWYRLRSNSSNWFATPNKDLTYFYRSDDEVEEKVIRYVPYTGPVVPQRRDPSTHLESVISLDLGDSFAGRESFKSKSLVGRSVISLHL